MSIAIAWLRVLFCATVPSIILISSYSVKFPFTWHDEHPNLLTEPCARSCQITWVSPMQSDIQGPCMYVCHAALKNIFALSVSKLEIYPMLASRIGPASLRERYASRRIHYPLPDACRIMRDIWTLVLLSIMIPCEEYCNTPLLP